MLCVDSVILLHSRLGAYNTRVINKLMIIANLVHVQNWHQKTRMSVLVSQTSQKLLVTFGRYVEGRSITPDRDAAELK